MHRVFLCLLFLSTTGFAQDLYRIDKLIQSYASKNEFMGSVLIARGDRVLFSKGFGYADRERRIPDIPTTRYQIGSITKQFTAAAVLMLEEQGKLKITDRVYAHLPEAPAAWNDVRIFHLLTQTSGIPEILGFPELQRAIKLPHTPEQLVTMLSGKSPEFAPGQRMKYSNSGYVLLGYIIERASGETYEQFLQKHIFNPLGMKDTGCEFTSDRVPGLAEGYFAGDQGPTKADAVHMSNAFSAGGMYSTTADLLRWEQGLFGGKVLSPLSLAKMLKPFKNGYALGVTLHSVNGRRQIGHRGSTWGFASLLTYFPKSGMYVAVLSNLRGQSMEEMAQIVSDLAHEETVVQPSTLKAIVLSASALFAICAGLLFVKRPHQDLVRSQEIRIRESSDAVIDVRSLTFAYSALEVLHGISFRVRRGEMVGLLGPNGAGKTTTIKILAGIHPTAGGKVRIAGYDLPEHHLEAKRIIGYLPESPLLYECLSGLEFLELMGRLQGLDENILHDRIRALLEAFELDNVRVPRMSGYSKGMRQKILLSAALLHDPEVLLLDEPLSGLDVDACILVKDLLTTLVANGKTILYSSHVLDVVEKVCHRVIVIDNGNILADAPLEELKSRTSEQSLEVIFRKLTHSEDTAPKIERVMEALRQ
jgi:ABC-type multidrug transport system ATPase subunit/CubicO group peptidase (beta-lactamase class C family)